MERGEERSPTALLAESEGIAPEYTDLWGETHAVEDSNLKLLLAALGVDPASPSVPPRLNLLDPVILFREGGDRTLKLGRELSSKPKIRLCGEPVATHAFNRAHRTVTLADPLPPGLYDGVIEADLLTETVEDRFTLIVAPKKGFEPAPAKEGQRLWGVLLPLYAVRSARNWGVGDLADLADAVDLLSGLGADAVGLLPLHALPNEFPSGVSPYYPWSRLWLNALYVAPDRVEEYAAPPVRALMESPETRERLQKLRSAELVDYEGVWELKRRVLRLMFDSFNPEAERGARFADWVEERRSGVEGFAAFILLRERFRRPAPSGGDWREWPVEYRNHDTPAVREFISANRREVDFHCWLQWLADGQLAAAAERAGGAGMSVGLYLDLALGVDPGGPDAWFHQDILALDASAGCPPDPFSLLGQEWGLPPVKPQAQRLTGYKFARLTIAANMRHAGALRIDHAAMLARLFWVPRGHTPLDGAYVTYPMEEQLALLRVLSGLNRCLVIGEDLGTLPPSLGEGLADSGFYSYRLLVFQREENRLFKAPFNFPAHSLVSFATHDLATLDGWWTSRDIAAREKLGRYPDEAAGKAEKEERAEDCRRLIGALVWQKLLPEGFALPANPGPELLETLAVAVHSYLARARSALLMANVDDLLGGLEMQNLPGTLQEHPNWRRKLLLPLEEWDALPRLARVVEAIRMERGASPREAAR